MKKKIEDILNDLSDSNDYNLKYIPEHNYNELVDKLNALFSLHVVGCSLPESKDRILELEKAIVSWDLKNDVNDKQAFSCGWNNCYRWIKDFVRQQR